MYIILDKNNIVIDQTTYLRYVIKQNEIFKNCDKDIATGIIGSDCNTYYDLQNITIVKSDNKNIQTNLYKYNPYQQDFICRYSLEELQQLKQTENKKLFNQFLKENPLIWTDGKKYGVTLEDQQEIQSMLNQYTLTKEKSVLEWHAQGEENVTWSFINLLSLLNNILSFVLPYYHQCQKYKSQIYNTVSIEEVNKIEIKYK